MKFVEHVLEAVLVALVIFGLLSMREAHADDLSSKCQTALSACDHDVEKLKEQVVVLKDSVKMWKKQAESPKDAPILLTALVAGAVGGGIGGYVSESSSGMAKGGMVGAALGLIIGLIAGGK